MTIISASLKPKHAKRGAVYGVRIQEIKPQALTKPPTLKSNTLGTKNSRVFHRPSCDGAATMNAKNRIIIESREKAIEEGFKPCPTCKP
ncbi:MAG: hypothetical protein LBT23_03290 [Synergistaceae bacterium]|nr:hypothetical protein [Synergistaceae bacterium]